MDDIHEDEVEQRNVTAKQKHGDDDDESGISQLLVAAKSFFLRIPRPGSFLKLHLHFAEEVFRFAEHFALFLKYIPRSTTPGGTRTPNRRFWRPLLYQLSYWRKFFLF